MIGFKEYLNEISDQTKRDWLDKAIEKHGADFGRSVKDAPAEWKAKWLTPTGKIKDAWWKTDEYKKRKQKLDTRRSSIQKTSAAVTGKKHYSDGEGVPTNANDWHKGKRYGKGEL